MNDYLLLMHSDARQDTGDGQREWSVYLQRLRDAGVFEGGSSIGDGVCISKSENASSVTSHLSGYIRVQAESLAAARELVNGNPVYEAGGTVEIRELPRD